MIARRFLHLFAALAAALAAAALLAACGSTTSLAENPAPVENRSTGAGTGTGATPSPAASAASAPQSHVTTVDLAAQNAKAAAASAQRIVYFDFDSFVIKDEFKPMIEVHAKALVADPKKHIVIEGSTDERGGSEYNLALGQKRAEAVAKALEVLGARDQQIEAVSFGKERPVDPGHDEAAWAKNRRAELKDR